MSYSTKGDTQARLEKWFIGNNGYLKEDLDLTFDEQNGQHFRATTDVSASEDSVQPLCRCPFSLTLSFLNVLETPPQSIRNCSKESNCTYLLDKLPTAAVSHFFLCEQKLLGEKSFWEPYISALPGENDMTTPWWFDNEDLMWLLGTNIHLSTEVEKSGVEMRRAMWKEHWETGVTVLKEAGANVEGFSWWVAPSCSGALTANKKCRELYLWAATIFSSRSFTSLIFTSSLPETSGKESFALLYPMIDSFNHKFGAKVLWNMDKGDFELSTIEPAKAGQEVFNNYAPKGNEELLNGYGFCIPDNPCDEVALRIGKPPHQVIDVLREQFPERFSSPKWTDDAAMFFLRGSDHYTSGYAHQGEETAHLRGMPPELLGTIRAILDFSYKEQGEAIAEEHLEPAAVDAIVERLISKYQGIRQWDDRLPAEPSNDKQRFAKIYRDGQLIILQEIIAELQEYLEQF